MCRHVAKATNCRLHPGRTGSTDQSIPGMSGMAPGLDWPEPAISCIIDSSHTLLEQPPHLHPPVGHVQAALLAWQRSVAGWQRCRCHPFPGPASGHGRTHAGRSTGSFSPQPSRTTLAIAGGVYVLSHPLVCSRGCGALHSLGLLAGGDDLVAAVPRAVSAPATLPQCPVRTVSLLHEWYLMAWGAHHARQPHASQGCR